LNNAGSLNNAGTFNLNPGGTLAFNNAAAEFPGGTFNWASSASVAVASGTTLVLDAPLTVETGRQLAINGTVQANASLASNGTLDVNSGGKLVFNSAASSLPNSINWNSGGILSVGSSGVLNIGALLNIGTGRKLEVQPGGVLNHTGGTLTVETGGLLENEGLLHNSANLTIGSSGNFTNSGEANHTGGTLTVETGGLLENEGLLHNSANLTIGSSGNFTNSGEANHTGGTLQVLGLFSNDGTLNLAASFTISSGGQLSNTGEANHTAGTFQIAGLFTNSGTLNNGAGLTISSGGQLNNTGEAKHNGGNLQIQSGGTVTNAAGAEFANNANITRLGSFSNNGSYKGSGTFFGFFQNNASGTFSPGNSPGCHSFGNSMGNAGTILLEIGGPDACSGHDRFGVTEGASLGGSLQIELVNGFVPTAGQEFTVLLADFVSGTFSSVEFPGGTTGTVLYFANEVKVRFQSILPVELVEFQATYIPPSGAGDSEKIRLAWETASEQNNEGFFVERSHDGRAWTELGFVAGKGTTNEAQQYAFFDEMPLSPHVGGCKGGCVNYYRLRQLDFDGKVAYSEVVSVKLSMDRRQPELIVYPNPVSLGGQLTLVLPEDAEVKMPAQLFDTAGRLLRSIEAVGGANLLDVSSLEAGMYYLRVGGFYKNITIAR
jgi:hypothetical protein